MSLWVKKLRNQVDNIQRLLPPTPRANVARPTPPVEADGPNLPDNPGGATQQPTPSAASMSDTLTMPMLSGCIQVGIISVQVQILSSRPVSTPKCAERNHAQSRPLPISSTQVLEDIYAPCCARCQPVTSYVRVIRAPTHSHLKCLDCWREPYWVQ